MHIVEEKTYEAKHKKKGDWVGKQLNSRSSPCIRFQTCMMQIQMQVRKEAGKRIIMEFF